MPTEKRLLTGDDVLDVLERAVSEYGKNWVDLNSGGGSSACLYLYLVDEDGNTCEPGPLEDLEGLNVRHCMVGKAIDLLVKDEDPVIRDRTTAMMRANNSVSSSRLLTILSQAEWFPYDFTADARSALEKAQSVQDHSKPWGEALRKAIDSQVVI